MRGREVVIQKVENGYVVEFRPSECDIMEKGEHTNVYHDIYDVTSDVREFLDE